MRFSPRDMFLKILLPILLIAFMSTAMLRTPPANAQTSPYKESESTVAYWRFENGSIDQPAEGNSTVLDYSGHNLNGTAFNNPIYRSNVGTGIIPSTNEKNTRSLEFNGRNQRVSVPDNPVFELTHALTLEAYVKVYSFTNIDNQLGHQILFRGDDRVGRDPYTLTVNGTNFHFQIQNESDESAGVEAPVPALNQWYHVAGTFDDRTNEMRLYVDGKLVAKELTLKRPFGKLDPKFAPGIGIGNVQSSAYRECFNGLIDEARISNIALTPDQFLISARKRDKPKPKDGIIATSLLICADDFVTAAYLNGDRIADDACTIEFENLGISVLRIKVKLHQDDWIVLNVASNRYRRPAAYGIAIAGLLDDKDPAFVSETTSGNWSACGNLDDAPKFISDRDFLGTQHAEHPSNASEFCKRLIGQRCDWNGETIWAKGESKNVWIKFHVPREPTN